MASKPVIGFIGIGVMGSSMAGHLIDAGYELNIYNRTAAKCEPLIRRGAKLLEDPGEVASESDVVITIIGFPKDVEDVYLAPGGIVKNARKGALLIDMTTSSPALAVKIYESAREKGVGACDAPVTGGDKGAREATLSIMVGGTDGDFDRAKPILQAMGKNIVHFGAAGCGQLAKLANQIVIASTMLGVCEGLAYAKKAGIDPEELIKCIENGAAGSWSLSNYGSRILNGDFKPGFFVKHFIKDMTLAKESSHALGLDMPGLETALDQYKKLADKGASDGGIQELYRLYGEDQ
jgi:3-hydroxyisobutyrate dehydrogenase